MREGSNVIYQLQRKKVLNFLPVVNLIGVLLGALGGYAYFYFIGCNTGTCPITSNPWMSILWGVAVGYLLSDMFYKGKAENKN